MSRFRGALIALLAAVGLSAAASSAQAGVENYCGPPPNPRFYPAYDTCEGPAHSIRSNLVSEYNGQQLRVCSAARLNGSFYGSYFCANAQACHNYSGGNVLTPLAHNGNSFPANLFGTDYFGVDSYGPCPIGS